MDRFEKPKDLETSPDPEAAAAFNYWLATFETFLRMVEAGQATTNPSVEVKKRTACWCFASCVLVLHWRLQDVRWSLSYTEACSRKINNTFSRGTFCTCDWKTTNCRKSSTISLSLEILSQGCWFLAVSSVQPREELRDAFIKGSNSQSIRRRFFRKIIHGIISQKDIQLNCVVRDDKTIGGASKADDDKNF